MTYKTKVSLLTAIVLIALYSYNFYFEHQEKEAKVEAGKEIKTNTNEYFLPTSTTGQLIHHNGYSLSYSEPHEQAEWVAYELKKCDKHAEGERASSRRQRVGRERDERREN